MHDERTIALLILGIIGVVALTSLLLLERDITAQVSVDPATLGSSENYNEYSTTSSATDFFFKRSKKAFRGDAG